MRIVGLRSSAWRCDFTPRAASVFALLVAFLCASCGGPPATHYYTLRMPPPPPANDPKTNFVLEVERFRAPELLRDDRIVFYESPTQLNFYQHHRWRADPAMMLSELAARWLEQTGIFAQVRGSPSREPADYLLKGRVLSFEEVDYEGAGKGRVTLALTLVRSRDRKAVWSARRQVESAIQQKGVPGVVNALNSSSWQLLAEVLPGLLTQVEGDFKEASKRQLDGR